LRFKAFSPGEPYYNTPEIPVFSSRNVGKSILGRQQISGFPGKLPGEPQSQSQSTNQKEAEKREIMIIKLALVVYVWYNGQK